LAITDSMIGSSLTVALPFLAFFDVAMVCSRIFMYARCNDPMH
jgi:Sec-independent protein secretion pathway component TatC